MKLGTNIHHLKFLRSAVKGQGHSETNCTLLRRRTLQQCGVEAELFSAELWVVP